MSKLWFAPSLGSFVPMKDNFSLRGNLHSQILHRRLNNESVERQSKYFIELLTGLRTSIVLGYILLLAKIGELQVTLIFDQNRANYYLTPGRTSILRLAFHS